MTASESRPRSENVARYQRELERIRSTRKIARALATTPSPEQAAEALGFPLIDVQRVSRRLRASFDPEIVTPAEIIGMRIAGEIDDVEMMHRLGEQTYTAGMNDPTGGDGYRRGTWDQVQSATGQGLLTIEQYNWLIKNADIRSQTI